MKMPSESTPLRSDASSPERRGLVGVPPSDSVLSSPEKEEREKSNFMPAMGNFSVQYNFAAASIAVSVLNDPQYLGHALLEEPAWSRSLTLGIVFVGCICGMLVMGRLGDLIGRTKAMRVTLSLAVCGALIPAFAGGPADLVYGVVCLGRFVLGIGVGGIYPLSAVSSAEGIASHEQRSGRVGQAFFWQTPGAIAPYVLAICILAFLVPANPEAWVPDLQFRVIFASGALPTLLVLWASMYEEDSTEFRANQQQQVPGMLEVLRNQPWQTWSALLGTSGAWFLYDVAYYGTVVFTPRILQEICFAGEIEIPAGGGEPVCRQTLLQTATQSVAVLSLGLPATVLAIGLLPSLGCKTLNIIGFIFEGALFAAMAVTFQGTEGNTAPGNTPRILFALFGILIFALNFGTSQGTYVLPALCFPPQIRSTCNGIAAASAKVGAAVGALLFPMIDRSSLGIVGVLWVQAVVCVLGAWLSDRLLRHDWEYLESTKEGKAGTGHAEASSTKQV